MEQYTDIRLYSVLNPLWLGQIRVSKTECTWLLWNRMTVYSLRGIGNDNWILPYWSNWAKHFCERYDIELIVMGHTRFCAMWLHCSPNNHWIIESCFFTCSHAVLHLFISIDMFVCHNYITICHLQRPWLTSQEYIYIYICISSNHMKSNILFYQHEQNKYNTQRWVTLT